MTELSALHVKISGDSSGLKAAMDSAKTSVDGLQDKLKDTDAQTNKSGAAFTGLGNVMGKMGPKIQNAGYQVQDLAIQLQGGVSPATAFAQQGSQLLSAFGPVGAVLGTLAAVGIPLLTAAFASGKSAAEAYADAIDEVDDSLRRVEDAANDAQRAINMAQAARAAQSAFASLRDELDGIFGIDSSLVDLFGVTGAKLGTLYKQFEAIGQAEGPEAQLAAYDALINSISSYTNNLSTASSDGVEFYRKLEDAANSLRRVVEYKPEDQQQPSAGGGDTSITTLRRSLMDEESAIADSYAEKQKQLDAWAAGDISRKQEHAALSLKLEEQKNAKIRELRQADLDSQLAQDAARQKIIDNEKQRLNDKVAALDYSLKSEREKILADYEERKTMLDEWLTFNVERELEHSEMLKQIQDERDLRLEEARQREIEAERLKQEEIQKLRDKGLAGLLVSTLGETQANEKGYADKVGATKTFIGDMISLQNSGSKKMAAIGKAFAIADAIVTGYHAAVEAWDKGMEIGGPPVAAAFTAASLAKTGALIAGMGGSGGGDRGGAAPVAAATQQARPERQEVSRNVTIQMAGGDMFGRDQVINLINQINEAVEDGAIVRVVA